MIKNTPNKNKHLNLTHSETPLAKRLTDMRALFLKCLIKYCNNSSLHGLQYVCNTKLPLIERLFWLTVFLGSLVVAVSISFLGIYKNWRDNPIVTVFDHKISYIGNIPFPSITICPYFAIKKSYVDLTTTNNSNMLFYASNACPMLRVKSPPHSSDNLNSDFFDSIAKAAPTCSDIFQKCLWKDTLVNCCDFFQPFITDLGLCFNFNIMPLDRIYKPDMYLPYPLLKYPNDTAFWNSQRGYPKDALESSSNNVLPLRVEAGGKHNSIYMDLLQNITEWQSYCSGAYSGFKVIVHSPEALPINTYDAIPIGMSRDNIIEVSPDMLVSHLDLLPLSPWKRNCYFNFEKELQFFKMYTYTNCMLECNSLKHIRDCGCVQFFMPRNKTTRICSKIEEFKCIFRNNLEYTMNVIKAQPSARIMSEGRLRCGCLQLCTKIQYDHAHFYSDFLRFGEKKPSWIDRISAKSEVTKLRVHFSTGKYLRKKRKSRYTTLSFIGKCGGLLSLFLGFSFLSAFEIIYFMLIRPISDVFSSRVRVSPFVVHVNPPPIPFLN